jgi:hypothetical protein
MSQIQGQTQQVRDLLAGAARGSFGWERLPNGLLRVMVRGVADFYIRQDGSLHSKQYR